MADTSSMTTLAATRGRSGLSRTGRRVLILGAGDIRTSKRSSRVEASIWPALRRLLPVRGTRQPVRVRAATGGRRRRLDQERRLQGGAHRGYVAVYIDTETFTRPADRLVNPKHNTPYLVPKRSLRSLPGGPHQAPRPVIDLRGTKNTDNRRLSTRRSHCWPQNWMNRHGWTILISARLPQHGVGGDDMDTRSYMLVSKNTCVVPPPRSQSYITDTRDIRRTRRTRRGTPPS